jgi:crotonobetainyl-CoA:carnitine CoA-transferase CaiB-like acyl-CoA transferase
MMLGDLGADVIKVERPGRGDDTRGWGPPFDARGMSAYFISINRNKISVAADLVHDRRLLGELIADADVVVENLLPGALRRAGYDSREILEQHPRLVWCTISGFGGDTARPGYDFVVQAESGWMAVTGEPGGDPMKAGVAVADLLAGRDAAIGILAALVGRGPGAKRHVEISLMDSARGALVNVAQNTLVTGSDAGRWGNAHANLVPYQLFRAGDRPLVIAVGSDSQWDACARALGLIGLADDPALRTNAGRIADRDRVTSEMQRLLETQAADHWIAKLGRAGVPCGVVKTVLEAVRDAATASPVTGMPSSVGGTVRCPPPRLDEHGAAVRASGWGAFSALPAPVG